PAEPTEATSAGSAGRPIGVSRNQVSVHSGWRCRTWSRIAVAVYPGETLLTRTPRRAHSPAIDLVSMMTPALDALYATWGCGWLETIPDIEAMLTIAPPPEASMCRPAARAQ